MRRGHHAGDGHTAPRDHDIFAALDGGDELRKPDLGSRHKSDLIVRFA